MEKRLLSQSSRQRKYLESGTGRAGISGLKGYTGGRKTLFKTPRPDILKLKDKARPLTTRSDAKKMIAANKASKFQKMNKKKDKKNVAGRAGIVGKKAATVGAGAGLVAVGYGAGQWINQSGPKKK